MDDAEGEEHDLVVRVDVLLGMPFEEALKAFPQLQQYILEHDDAASLQKEFQQSWHPEAPRELRDVLEELLDPEAHAAAADAAQRLEATPSGLEMSSFASPPEEELSPHRIKVQTGVSDDMASGLRFMPESSDTPESPLWAMQRAESSAPEADDEDSVAAEIEALLSTPFEEAVQRCTLLQRYLGAQGDDAKDIEEEFRVNWSLDAPQELRDVLRQMLDPEADAENTQQSEEFVQRMLPSEPRSKL